VARQLRFDRYVLDLDRGCLLLEGSEVALRPKTFAVLNYLTQNPHRLVSKDELVAAVWAHVVVTDDALVQSVGELRRALADDGSRLIRTIPRRGYRLECDVSEYDVSMAAPTVPAVAAAAPLSAESGSELHAPVRDGVARTALDQFRSARVGWRIGLLSALALVTVVAAGIRWGGIGTEWLLPDAPNPGNPPAITKPETGAKAAIAILPFEDNSDDSSREYFADGLTQDIINALGRFPELTVMSWNAVSAYKGKRASPEEIARSLSVRYQVEGSVVQTAGRVRVIAQLVNAEGRVVWSGRFDEALADLFALQGRITTEIAGALAIRVTKSEQQRVLAKPAESFEAYDYVLRTRSALQRPTRANNAEARALLRHAIQLDQDCAACYAALAETYHVAVVMGWAESPAEILGRAEEMAQKALNLNEAEVRAHVILGRIHIFHHRYEQAKAEMDRTLAINPNDAHGLAGRGNVLMWLGQTDAAIEALEQAQRIDPELNAIDRNALSLAYYLKRRYEAAIGQAELNLRETAAANFSRIVLAAAYAQQNRIEDAAAVATVIRRTDPTFEPLAFGSKFLNPDDLEHVRDGFRKAGLFNAEADARSSSQ
jgi:TolB-like protein/DNA-binding winged helix-turn-helix (wHTH) protein/cytochrome c-type biogenesis protein CcmH/NrfG